MSKPRMARTTKKTTKKTTATRETTRERPPKVFSYLRFSSAKQGEPGKTSTSRQRRMADKWAREQGVEIDPLRYQDIASGSTGAHLDGALGAFREALREGRLIRPGDRLIVEAIDRLSRLKRLDAMDVVKEIVSRGVEIITLEDGESYTKERLDHVPGLLEKLSGKIEQSRSYAEKLSHNLREAWEIKHERAKRGEAVRKRAPLWLRWDQESETYVENHHAATVREVYRLAMPHKSQGKQRASMSAVKIARTLNKANAEARERGEAEPWPLMGQGLKIRKLPKGASDEEKEWIRSKNEKARARLGRGWTSDRIAKLLMNRAVTGEVELLTTLAPEEIKDRKRRDQFKSLGNVQMYPAVVSMADWEIVQRDRKSFRTIDHDQRQDQVSNLFTRLTLCGRCKDSPLVVHKTKRHGNDYTYQICRSRKQGGNCKGGASWRLEALEDHVLSGLAWAGNLVGELVRTSQRLQDDDRAKGLRDDLARAERALEIVRGNLKRANQREMSDEMMDELDAELKTSKARVKSAKERLRGVERAEREAREAEEAAKGAFDVLDQVDDLRKSPEGRLRLRRAISAVTTRIDVGLDDPALGWDDSRVTIHLAWGVAIRSLVIPGGSVMSRDDQGRWISKPGDAKVTWALVDQVDDDLAEDDDQVEPGE